MTPGQRVRVALSAYAVVLLTGFVGYQVIAGAGPLDALYMTVITVTTVGFGEVFPLGPGGRVFTMLLIAAGVGSATYALVSASEYVVEGHLREMLGRRRMERRINALHDHVIVCGFGRVGRHLVAELLRNSTSVVVVDLGDDRIDQAAQSGALWVRGDATEEHVLQEAGLDSARALVACVDSDASNVLVTLTARGLRRDLTIIARAKEDENEPKLARAGADRVIAPTTIGGRRIAQLLTRPVVADFLDALGPGGIEYTLEEVPVRPGGPLDHRSLRDAEVPEQWGCTVLAVRRGRDGVVETHPAPETVLAAGDVLVVLGSEADAAAMHTAFVSRSGRPTRPAADAGSADAPPPGRPPG